MLRLYCHLKIRSGKSLHEVAGLISGYVLGGTRFTGHEEHIFDEVPAVYAEQHVLGLEVILHAGDESIYFLEMDDCRPLDPAESPDDVRRSVVDISPMVARLLERADGISVSCSEQAPLAERSMKRPKEM